MCRQPRTPNGLEAATNVGYGLLKVFMNHSFLDTTRCNYAPTPFAPQDTRVHAHTYTHTLMHTSTYRHNHSTPSLAPTQTYRPGLAPLIPGSSDIGQLALMQQLLGSFSTSEWPELAQLPDWGKVVFEESSGVGLAALLPDAPEDGLDLLGRMLRCAIPRPHMCTRVYVCVIVCVCSTPVCGGNGWVCEDLCVCVCVCVCM
jgi:hypothetical protein